MFSSKSVKSDHSKDGGPDFSEKKTPSKKRFALHRSFALFVHSSVCDIT